MKLIPLTRGKFAKVDDADYEWLMQRKWNAIQIADCPHLWYASSYTESLQTSTSS